MATEITTAGGPLTSPAEIVGRLKAIASPQGSAGPQRFHKEPINAWGVPMAQVRALAKDWFDELKPLGKDQIFNLCEPLWQSGVLEESQLAAEVVYRLKRQFEERDIDRFEHWIANYVNNWATCDNFCNNSVGAWLMHYPDGTDYCLDWALRPNRWLQRAAAVSLIVPARKGFFLDTIFTVADRLIASPDDLVQKGYGWALKVASHAHPELVFDFLKERKQVMPRTALRYALEDYPKEERLRILKGGSVKKG